jgi:hypothetical protein
VYSSRSLISGDINRFTPTHINYLLSYDCIYEKTRKLEYTMSMFNDSDSIVKISIIFTPSGEMEIMETKFIPRIKPPKLYPKPLLTPVFQRPNKFVRGSRRTDN